ncbi:type II RES/Xre toxin-antitoxin system antitoxin [Bradyrhizobium guangdongense]|jgi:putative toxin-antitoxin system antitoxin component (TIGR02293 family)|uniref:type II RES/Xre toxin-antitoxin system antitoxin n=1 Tax=Bradyrhizobium guangdongense TaxID=1325090 RepID=UPI001319D62F|nr:antitoxin Xre/MbcA/ParS toxin-binding domain-containing protein [Bradyrhizobium guangdongense]
MDEFAQSRDVARLTAVARLLGGTSTFRKMPQSPLEAHEALVSGLPSKALVYLVANFASLRWDDSLERAIGMSHRTYQRHTAENIRHLSPEQSGRAWKLAEILAKATSIFGSKEEAEHWLERPAIGLDQRKPIDLLATPAGVELVEDFLTRLEYGVYA